MVLTLGVMGFAVFAAATQVFKVTNTISFVSDHVLATVVGTVSNAMEGSFINYASTTTTASDDNGVLGTWEVGDNMQFASEDNEILVTLTITNNSLERSFSFELSGQKYSAWNGEDLDNTNVDRFVSYSINNENPVTNKRYLGGQVRVEPRKVAVIVISVGVHDTAKSVNNFNNSFTLDLRNLGEGEELPDEAFKYYFDPITETLSVPDGFTVTYDNLPEIYTQNKPLFYGLYGDEASNVEISIPYTAPANIYLHTKLSDENLYQLEFEDYEAYYSVGAQSEEGFAKAMAASTLSAVVPSYVQIPLTYLGVPVTMIADDGFANETALSEIDLTDLIQTIGNRAFYNASGLTGIVLPNGVIEIGTSAFENAISLQTFTSNLFVKHVGEKAFFNTPWFDGLNDGLVYIGKALYTYKGEVTSGAEIEVAAGVVSISPKAFQNQIGLKYILFPETLTHIGESAFLNCSELMYVYLPQTILFVGKDAFKGCQNMILYVEDNTTPQSWNETWNSSNNPVYWGVTYVGVHNDQVQYVISYDNIVITRYLHVGDTVVIPSQIEGVNVTQIGERAFIRSLNLKSITIPETVTIIGNSAFYGCENLETIYLNATNLLNFIDNNQVFALAGKSKAGITVYVGSGVTRIPTNLFYPSSDGNACPKIKEVAFASGSVCTTIGDNAFRNLTALSQVNLPNTITSIGASAFRNILGPSTFTISSTVTTIGQYAFLEVANLQNFSVSESNPNFKSVDGVLYNKNITTLIQSPMAKTSVTIPSSVTTISNYAFYKTTLLTEIYLNATNLNNMTANNYAFFRAGKNAGGITMYVSADVSKIPAYMFHSDGSAENSANIVTVHFASGSTITRISEYAFYRVVGLTTILIPSTVTNIDTYAFFGCVGLTNLVIPSGITSIESYAFAGCTGLTSLVIPSNVTTIKAYAFENATSLQTLMISQNVTSIGAGAFSGSVNLTAIDLRASNLADLFDGSNVFYNAGKSRSGVAVQIKNTVSRLPAHLFHVNNANNAAKITSVTFEANSTLTSIGANAFKNTEIVSITLPSSLTTVEAYAFMNTTKLQNIFVDESSASLASIDGVLFDKNITSLLHFPQTKTEANIPETVTTIANGAFYNALMLSSLNIYAENLSNLTASNQVFYSAGRGGAGIDVLIGENVTNIPSYLFNPSSNIGYSPKLKSVSYEGGLAITRIGDYAFAYNTSLASIFIPISVQTVGAHAFRDAVSLVINAEIDAKPALWHNDWNSSGLPVYWNEALERTYNNQLRYTYENGAITISEFLNNSSHVVIPESIADVPVVGIEENAFAGCDALISITIPSSVVSIGDRAFYGTVYLREINFNPTNLNDFVAENEVFYNAGRSGSGIVVNVGANVTKIPSRLFSPTTNSNYSPKITSVVFKANSECVSIGESAFYQNTYLSSINLPSTISSIGAYAFYNCTALTAINLPFGLTAIYDYTFYNCYNLTSVVIPSGVTSIGNYAFYNCSRMTSIQIPATVNSFGNYTFYGCSALTSIQIPSGITSIGNYTFYNCYNLSAIDLPSNLTSIGNYAFYGNNSLTQITLPQNLSSIGESALLECAKLESIFVHEDNTTFASVDGVLYNKSITTLILVPRTKTSVTIPETVTAIVSNAFYRSLVTSITIPAGIKTLGSAAFYQANALQTIDYQATNASFTGSSGSVFSQSGIAAGATLVIGPGVTSIPSYLANQANIASIEFAEGGQLSTIGEYAFASIATLRTIMWNIPSMPDLVSGNTVFYNSGVTSVGFALYVGENVTRIPGYLFASSSHKLTSLQIAKNSNLNSIGAYAFANSKLLKTIYFNALNLNDLAANNNVFFNVGADTSGVAVYVGNEVTRIPAYLFNPNNTTANAPKIASVVFEDNSACQTIATYAFAYNIYLSSIVIPSSVSVIEDYAFRNCSILSIHAEVSSQPAGWTQNWNFSNCPVYWDVYAVKVYNNDLQYMIDNGEISIIGFLNNSNIIVIPSHIHGIPVTKIENNVFAGSTTLLSVTIPETMMYIGESAFSGCTSLTNVTILATNLKSIGKNAFYNCTALTTLELTSAETIGENAFYNCSALTRLNIPENVTKIENNAFYGTTRLVEIIFNATALQDLAEQNGAFYRAGYSASGITFTIGQGVTRIPANLFYSNNTISNNARIISIIFAENAVCTDIGAKAFYNVSGYSELFLPSSVQNVGALAFRGSTLLTQILVSENNEHYQSIEGVLYSKDGTTIVLSPEGNNKDIVISETVTTILDYAFYNNIKVTGIYLNANLSDFASSHGIFYNLGNNLTGIPLVVGANVTRIPANIMRGQYTKISSLTFEAGSALTSIGEYAFNGNTSLESIVLPAELQTIGVSAFSGTSLLKTIQYRSTALQPFTSGNNVFLNAGSSGNGITVNISANVTSIPAYLFASTTTPSNNAKVATVNFLLGSQCVSIGTYAFAYLANMTTIKIPDSVTEIGAHAFRDCSLLTIYAVVASQPSTWNQYWNSSNCPVQWNSTNIGVYDDMLEYVYKDGGITIIKFLNVTNTVVIPNQIENIDVLRIGENAFANASNITSVTLPSTLIEIGKNAFNGCTNLKHINIPNGVTTIGEYAFNNNTSALSLTIPESVVMIGNFAFASTSSLTNIYYNALSIQDRFSNNRIFAGSGVSYGATLRIGANVSRIPNYMFNPYNSSSYSQTFRASTIIFETNVADITIGTYAFSYNYALNSLTLPEGLTSIGDFAFYNCQALQNFTIPSTVSYLGTRFLEGTTVKNIGLQENNTYFTSLEGVIYTSDLTELVIASSSVANAVIPNSVTSIRTYAFNNNGNLTNITVSNSLTTIGAFAFNGNTKLRAIELPETLTSIGQNAFASCYEITTITIPAGVQFIGSGAFSSMSRLSELRYFATQANDFSQYNTPFNSMGSSLPSGTQVLILVGANVTYLPNYTFDGLTKVTQVQFEENSTLVKIGNYAMRGMTGLSSLQLPASVEEIGSYAFDGSSNLISINIPKNLKTISTYAYARLTRLKELIMQADSMNSIATNAEVFTSVGSASTGVKLSIQNNVQTIPNYFFYGNNSSYVAPKVTEIEFQENGVDLEIGVQALRGLTLLQAISIPLHVTVIKSAAFENCSMLTIYVSASAQPAAWASNWNSSNRPVIYNAGVIGTFENTFQYSIDNAEVTITALIPRDLTELTIPSEIRGYAVTKLANSVFSGLSTLVTVNLPNTLVEIGERAFKDCTNLENIVLPDSLRIIKQYAFQGVSKIRTFTIPAGVTTIGTYAFSNMSNLEEIYYYPTIVNDFTTSSNVFTGVGSSVHSMYHVTFYVGATVKNIPNYFLYNNSRITRIIFEENGILETIGISSFHLANKITEMSLFPGTLQTIGNNAFNSVSSLVSPLIFPEGLTSIGSSAFNGAVNVEKIHLPKSLKTIGSNAFQSMSKVNEIRLDSIAINDFAANNNVFSYVGQSGTGIQLLIGNEVTRIPNYFFSPYNSSSYAPKIKSVQFDSGSVCTEIGTFAFAYNPNIEIITIPLSVSVISANAFINCTKLKIYAEATEKPAGWVSSWNPSNCPVYYNVANLNVHEGFEYTIENEEVKIISIVDKTLTQIEIPAQIAGYPVTKIAEAAFMEMASLTNLILPNTITEIGPRAFQNARNLASLTIPESVRIIEASAFSGLTSLQSLTIPESVEFIGATAFNGMTNLSSLYYKAKTMSNFASNANVFTNMGNSLPVGTSVVVTIANSVEIVPSYLLYGLSKVTQLVFEENSKVTSIGNYAFANMTGLTELNLPSSIVQINSGAFYGLTNISSLDLPEGILTIGASAFQNLTSLITLKLPESLKTIGSAAFYNLNNLTTLTIPKSVESIGTQAFFNMYQLTQINYNAINVANLASGNNVFYNAGLHQTGIEVTIGNEVSMIPNYLFSPQTNTTYHPRIKTVVFESGSVCTTIGDSAFRFVLSMQSIIIPASVINIGSYAFSDCTALTIYAEAASQPSGWVSSWNNSNRPVIFNYNNIAYDETFEYQIVNGEVKIVALKDKTLTEIVIPEQINGMAVTSIGAEAFYKLNAVTSVVLPTTLVEIGANAFRELTSLTAINLPNSLISIGEYAFYGCTALTSMTVPENVQTIGRYAFDNLHMVDEFYYNAERVTNASTGPYIVRIGANLPIGVPIVVTIGANVKHLPDYLFSGAIRITRVMFKENSALESIGQYALAGLTGITEIALPDSVQHIYNYALSSTSNLSELVLPSGLITIGNSAFYNLPNIASLTIPESVTSIGTYAFYGWRKLSQLNYDAIAVADLTTGNYTFAYAGYASDGVQILVGSQVTRIPANLFYSHTNAGISGKFGNVVFEENSALNEIGSQAFAYLSSFGTITIPVGVQTIADNVFNSTTAGAIFTELSSKPAGWSSNFNWNNQVYYNSVGLMVHQDYAYKIENESITIVAMFNKNVVSLIVPSQINGYSVTKLGAYAFYAAKKMTSIILPTTIIEIENYAFSDCTALVSINLSANIITMGTSVFYNNSALTIYAEPASRPAGWHTNFYSGRPLIWGVTENGTLNGFHYTIQNNAVIITGYVSGASINIPAQIRGYDVAKIASDAFANASSMTSITLPSTLLEIGERAFENCTGLTTITIPYSVITIGANAFAGCSALSLTVQTPTIPSGWASSWNSSNRPVNHNATFSGIYQGLYQFTITAGTARISNYLGTNLTEVIIPSEIYGYPVAMIMNSAFISNTMITSIVLPNTVREIGSNTFQNMNRLESIVLPEGLEKIGNYAFNGASKLQEITIPSTVTSIGSYAFGSLSMVKNVYYNAKQVANFNSGSLVFQNMGSAIGANSLVVYIGASVEHIPDYIFHNISNISAVYFAEGSALKSVGNYAFSNLNAVTDLVLPNTIQTIGNNSFASMTSLKTFNLPDSLITLGQSAFDYARNAEIESMVIPIGVTTIGAYAFRNMAKVTAVTIPENVTSIGSYSFSGMENLTQIFYNVKTMSDFSIQNQVFRDAGISNVGIDLLIGNKVKRIPGHLFNPNNSTSNSMKLSTIAFENGSVCLEIGTYAFANNLSLHQIVIPSSVTIIQNYAFSNSSAAIVYAQVASKPAGWQSYWNTSLRSVYFGISQILTHDNFAYIVESGKVTITSYANFAIFSLQIPSEIEGLPVTKIAPYAFANRGTLTEVVLPNGLLEIGTYAFQYTGIEGITIPESVTIIGNYAFTYTSKLKEIKYNAINISSATGVFAYSSSSVEAGVPIVATIGSQVVRIPSYFFQSASKITDVVFEETSSLTTIGSSAFASMTTIKQLILPDSVKTIESYAFQSMSYLETINIPVNVTSVADYAYSSLSRLTRLEFDAKLLNGPSSSYYSDLFSNTGISGTGVEIVIGNTVTRITNYFFFPRNPFKVTSVVFEEGSICTYIGSYAFAGLFSLQSMFVPSFIVTMGGEVFNGCTALTLSVPLASKPSGWSSSWNGGRPVLWNYSQVESNETYHFIIENGTATILLLKDTSLTDIVIPTQINGYVVTKIGDDAFAKLTTLKSIVFPDTLLEIGARAFQDCTGLTSLVFPNGLLAIGASAFQGCTGISSLSIPSGLQSIGSNAFSGMSKLYDLQYHAVEAVNTSGSSIFNSMGAWAGIGVPVVITIGAQVKSIPNAAFSGANRVSEVVFESSNTLESIGSSAFNNMTGLTRLDIPSSVKTIGSNAFSGSSNITSINLPEELLTVGSYAYQNLSKLTELRFEAKTLGDLGDGNQVFGSSGFGSTGIVVYVGNQVTRLPNYIFYPYYYKYSNSTVNSTPNLLRIEFAPNSICTEIGSYAFQYTTTLRSLVIPLSITSIKSYAFQYSSVVIYAEASSKPAGWVSNWNPDNRPVYYSAGSIQLHDNTFEYRVENDAVTIVSMVAKMKEVIIPSTIAGFPVTKIGDDAFSRANITKITLPNTLLEIGARAFYDCQSLTSINIPESVTTIGTLAFYNCISLSTISVPTNVLSIGAQAYANLNSLEELVYNAENANHLSAYAYPFQNIGSTVPSDIQVSIKIGASVKALPNYIFYNLSRVTQLLFDENSQLETVGSYACYGMNGLTELNLPSSLITIRTNAFYGLGYVTSIEIPENVTTIETNAFYGLYRLTSIYFNAINMNNLTQNNHVFSFVGQSSTGVVAYIGSQVTRIPAFLFSPFSNATNYVLNLTQVVFAENSVCEEIGVGAFAYRSSLQTITIPLSVTMIGANAFLSCTALTIYAQAESKPVGWESNWNPSNRPVNYNS